MVCYYVLSCHAISCYVMVWYVIMSCHVTSRYFMLRYVMVWYVIMSCHVTLFHVTSWYGMLLCPVMSRYFMLRYVMVWYVIMSCHVRSYLIMLRKNCFKPWPMLIQPDASLKSAFNLHRLAMILMACVDLHRLWSSSNFNANRTLYK